MIFVFLDVDQEELDRLQAGMKASFLKMDMGHKWPRLSTISLYGYGQHDRSENKVSWYCESWIRYESEDEQSDEPHAYDSMYDSSY